MALVYSARFVAGSFAAGLSGVVYTVPAGKTAVLRDMSVFADGGAAGYAAIILTGVATLASVVTPASGPAPSWEGRQVLNAGETIKININGGTCEVAISGYLLD
jgi:hypothetical protein